MTEPTVRGRFLRPAISPSATDLPSVEPAILSGSGASPEMIVAALDQGIAAVVITDTLGRVVYANRAAADLIGQPVDWLRGRHFAMLMGDDRALPAIDHVAAGVASGQTWAGTMVVRHLDGSPGRVSLLLAPVRSTAGDVTHAIALLREIEHDEEVAEALATTLREQGSVVASLAKLDGSQPLHVLAGEVAAALLALDGVTGSRVISFGARDRGEVLAERTRRPARASQIPISLRRTRQLRVQAAKGAWVEAARTRRGLPHERDDRCTTLNAVAYAPLRHAGQTVGLLAIGTDDPRGTAALERHIGTLSHVGVLASGVLGARLAAREQDADLRAEIKRVIDEGAFATVFQPIVRLADRQPFGFEALTRFSDAVPPDRRFDDAHALGLGVDLEIATLFAALEAARRLPPNATFSVNLSPRLVLEHTNLARVLRHVERPLIFEVTERQPINDYPAFRRSMKRLGPGAWAVDDAGAGYASLRHIIELRPDYVKLDRGLVAAIASDPVRQALIAGMLHFAPSIGVRIIAEGVETEAERLTLLALGVEFGQGYLFGRPDRQEASEMGARPGADEAVIAEPERVLDERE